MSRDWGGFGAHYPSLYSCLLLQTADWTNNSSDTGAACYSESIGAMADWLPVYVMRRADVLQFIHLYLILLKKELQATYNDL